MNDRMAIYVAESGLPLAVTVLLLALLATLALLRGTRFSPFRTDGVIERFLVSWPGVGVYVSLAFLAANQLLVRGAASGIWDVDGQFFPYFALLADHIRAGEILTWDPWTNAGMAVMGDPQFGALSPLTNFLAWLLGGSATSFRIYWLLLWWSGGMGILVFGRHLKAPPWGGGVLALAYLFCGIYTGNAEHTSWITGFSFLPWIIWRLDVALLDHRARAAAEAGALWGLSALSGYPGLVVLTGCFSALWAAGRWWHSQSRADDECRHRTARPVGVKTALVSLLLFSLVGGAVLQPVYVSFFYEGAGTHPRVGALGRAHALRDPLPPGALATLTSPVHTAMKSQHPRLWAGSDPSMVNTYVGLPTLFLAGFALLAQPRSRWRWWLLAMAGLGFTAAMGGSLPVRGWLYDLFPPLRYFSHSSIFRVYGIFVFFVLALLGCRELSDALGRGIRRWSSFRSRLAAGYLGLLLVTVVVVFHLFGISRWAAGLPASAVWLGRVHLMTACAGLSACAGLVWWSVRPDPPQPPCGGRPCRWGLLKKTAVSLPLFALLFAGIEAQFVSILSIPTVLRLGDAAGRWESLDRAHSTSIELTLSGLSRDASACPDLPPDVRCRHNDQYFSKVPVFSAYASEINPFHSRMIREPVLRNAATGSERIWFSSHVLDIPPSPAGLTAFEARARELGQPPLVIHSISPRGYAASGTQRSLMDMGDSDKQLFEELARLPAAERISASVLQYTPRSLILEVDAPRDGWMLVTDRWARSWRAKVDDEPRPILAGNFIFRAVHLTAGRHRVRFSYNPIAIPWLMAASWAVVGLIFLNTARAAWRTPPRRPEPGS